MLYPDVHAALKDLAEAYDRFTQDDPASRQVEFARLIGSRATDLGIVLAGTANRFLSTPEAEARGLELLKSATIMKLLDERGVGHVVDAVWHNLVMTFLDRLAQRQGGFTFEPEAFESLYGELESYLSRGSDEYMLRAPLRNLEMTDEQFVAAGFTLRRMTRDEFVVYNGFTVSDPTALKFVMHQAPCNCILERLVVVRRGEAPMNQANADRFWWFVASLKLVKAGSVRYDEILVHPTTWETMSFAYSSLNWLRARPDRSYRFDGPDRDKVAHLISMLEGFVDTAPPFWKLALERLVDGIDRTRNDEALLDFWIACESLLGGQFDQGELSYRLTLRLAHLLETTEEGRRRVKVAARAAYATRSKIVHGDVKLSDQKLKEDALTMEDLTRRAVLRCIERGWTSKGAMLDDLETSVLGGSMSAR